MNQVLEVDQLFGRVIKYPDSDCRRRLNRLVGLDENKTRLQKILTLLINLERLRRWASEYHPKSEKLLDTVMNRPPLVVLAGDVGSGKTELSETIGDAVSRMEDIPITLFPLSLSARGQGRVGEMTQLLTEAFKHTCEEARRLQRDRVEKARGAVILLVDEADALAQSRETAQMHHEDRAGVNALIRGIDSLASDRLPAAVIMCTNRIDALDPAIRRRAADILLFGRPNNDQRRVVLEPYFREFGFSAQEIDDMVAITGICQGRSVEFTFSDLMQRLIPNIVLDAYPDSPVIPERALQIAREMSPTPPFKQEEE